MCANSYLRRRHVICTIQLTLTLQWRYLVLHTIVNTIESVEATSELCCSQLCPAILILLQESGEFSELDRSIRTFFGGVGIDDTRLSLSSWRECFLDDDLCLLCLWCLCSSRNGTSLLQTLARVTLTGGGVGTGDNLGELVGGKTGGAIS